MENLFHWLVNLKLKNRSLFTIGQKIGTFQPKCHKIYFFYQHSQPLYNVMRKENKNLEFVQGVNFEFIDWSKNNGSKYLLIFDDSGEEIRNSKAFVDIATAGRHWGLSTIYIKHNFFTTAN